jgi:chemotaxis regulatin CheY-phosphate phosphatase CheZ
MSQMADAIAKLAGEVLETTSSSGEKGVLLQAARTFEKVLSRANSWQNHYGKILLRLRDIGARTTTNLKSRSELAQALASFGPLARGFKIEISRLDEDDAARFLALTESISTAQSGALASIDRYFEGLTQLLQFIQGIAARLAAYSERLVQDLIRTRSSLNEHLSSLKERWFHAAEAGAAADVAVRDIVVQIGKIIVASQYQDIAHQQIEHITQALNEIQKEFAGAGDEQSNYSPELISFVRHAGLVQCHQMHVVADEVDQASQTIVQGMQHILDSAGKISGSRSADESSDGDMLGAFCGDIASIAELGEAGSVISQDLSAWIGPAVQALQVLAADMQKYSILIRFTAINAQIHARRTSEGAVLEVLATELRVAADESLCVIDQMSRFMTDVIRDLNGDIDQARVAAIAEGDQLRKETAQVAAMLEQVQTELLHKTAELTSLYTKLADDTQLTISMNDLQGKVITPVLKVKSAMEELVGLFELGAEAESDPSVRRRIAALRDSYTMQGEREVHDLVAKSLQNGTKYEFNSKPAGRAAHVPHASESDSQDANVELF